MDKAMNSATQNSQRLISLIMNKTPTIFPSTFRPQTRHELGCLHCFSIERKKVSTDTHWIYQYNECGDNR